LVRSTFSSSIILFAYALTCFGAGVASIINDFQGFQLINQFLIFLLFFLSSALYPLYNVLAALKIIASISPRFFYFVDALKYILAQQSQTDQIVILATVIVINL
jgi:ABC-2 type transport system permease protein